MLNNFSAAGENTDLLVEDAPAVVLTDHIGCRSTYLVAVPVKSKYSMQRNVEALLVCLYTYPEVALPSLVYTSIVRHMHHNYRVIVTGYDIKSVKDVLRKIGPSENVLPVPASTKVPEANSVFTGQGTMHSGLLL